MSHFQFTAAEGELLWRYTSAEGAIGLKAQKYNFDMPRREGMIDTGDMLVDAFERVATAKHLRAIDATLWRLPAALQSVLADAYQPRAWPGLLRATLSLSGSRHAVCLAGLARRSPVALAAKAERKSREEVLVFLEWEARAQNRSLLTAVRTHCERVLSSALAAYDPLRRERVDAERTESRTAREAWVDQQLGRLEGASSRGGSA